MRLREKLFSVTALVFVLVFVVPSVSEARCGRAGCSGVLSSGGSFSQDFFFENPFFNRGFNDSRFFFDFNNGNNFRFINSVNFNPVNLVTQFPSFEGFRDFTNRTRLGEMPAFFGSTGFGNGSIFNTGGFPTPLDPVFGSFNLGRALGFNGRGGGFGNFAGGYGRSALGEQAGFCGSASHGLVGGCGSFGQGFNQGLLNAGPLIPSAIRPVETPSTLARNDRFEKWKELFEGGEAFLEKDIQTLRPKWKQFAGAGVRAYQQQCALADSGQTFNYTLFAWGSDKDTYLSLREGFIEPTEANLAVAKKTWVPLSETDSQSLTTEFRSGTKVWLKKILGSPQGLNFATKMTYQGKDYFCKTMNVWDQKTESFASLK